MHNLLINGCNVMDFELEFSRSGERYNVTNLDESRNRQLTPRSLSRKLLSFGRIYIAAREWCAM